MTENENDHRSTNYVHQDIREDVKMAETPLLDQIVETTDIEATPGPLVSEKLSGYSCYPGDDPYDPVDFEDI